MHSKLWEEATNLYMESDSYAMFTAASFIIMKKVYNNNRVQSKLYHIHKIQSFIYSFSLSTHIYCRSARCQVLLGARDTMIQKRLGSNFCGIYTPAGEERH